MRKRWVIFALVFVFLINVYSHLMPLFNYELWGSDGGEYYLLSKLFLEFGNHFTYNGWGMAYKEFPPMFYLIDIFHLVSGVSLYNTTRILIPLISAFSTVFIFLAIREFGGRSEAALFGAIFFALAFPRIYATSHTMLGTLGDFFISAVFFLYLRYRSRGEKKLLTLVIVFTAVTATVHHLSAFNLAVGFMSIAFFKAIARIDNKEIMDEYIIGALALMFSVLYWWTTDNFRTRIVEKGSHMPFYLFAVLIMLALAVGYVFIKWMVRHPRSDWVPNPVSFSGRVMRLVGLILILAFSMIFLMIVGLPGMGVYLTRPDYLITVSPLLLSVAFAGIGPSYMNLDRSGRTPLFWVLGVLVLFFGAYIIDPTLILPYRLMQYLIIPTAILVGIGIYCFGKDLPLQKLKAPFYVIMITVVLGCALSSIPPKYIMGGFQEGTTTAEMESVYWSRSSMNDSAVVATDHRMSSMEFGIAGKMATWDYAYETLHGNYSESKEELNHVRTPVGYKQVNYVLVTDDIRKGVALLQWNAATEMSYESQEKFNDYPFVKVYANGQSDIYYVTAH